MSSGGNHSECASLLKAPPGYVCFILQSEKQVNLICFCCPDFAVLQRRTLLQWKPRQFSLSIDYWKGRRKPKFHSAFRHQVDKSSQTLALKLNNSEVVCKELAALRLEKRKCFTPSISRLPSKGNSLQLICSIFTDSCPSLSRDDLPSTLTLVCLAGIDSDI